MPQNPNGVSDLRTKLRAAPVALGCKRSGVRFLSLDAPTLGMLDCPSKQFGGSRCKVPKGSGNLKGPDRVFQKEVKPK